MDSWSYVKGPSVLQILAADWKQRAKCTLKKNSCRGISVWPLLGSWRWESSVKIKFAVVCCPIRVWFGFDSRAVFASSGLVDRLLNFPAQALPDLSLCNNYLQWQKKKRRLSSRKQTKATLALLQAGFNSFMSVSSPVRNIWLSGCWWLSLARRQVNNFYGCNTEHRASPSANSCGLLRMEIKLMGVTLGKRQ